MDKEKFSLEKFVENVTKSAVFLAVPPRSDSERSLVSSFFKFDVTICICSFKRTHNLREILEKLWYRQDYNGSYQIIVWNNNESRTKIVADICSRFIARNTNRRSMELISSSDNHFCTIRFAMPSLMKSDYLLICDDDIIPGSNFISFFSEARNKYPNDVCCLRGHKFLPHKLDLNNPHALWQEYEHLKFVDDHEPEQFIHFVHADACIIPKAALHEIASVEMPDPQFDLVDDYWMSYILNHKFKRNLRKLSIEKENSPVNRSDDSDDEFLALYKSEEVKDAKIRFYIHHMLQGWPSWECEKNFEKNFSTEMKNHIKTYKKSFWQKKHLGFNISSKLNYEKIAKLAKTGATCVRIGAVGVDDNLETEFSDLLTNHKAAIKRLGEKLLLLSQFGIDVILTLGSNLASPQLWKCIAEAFATMKNVIGYDIINEPIMSGERNESIVLLNELDHSDASKMIENYKEIIKAIRTVDSLTPIIVEPSFWAHIDALKFFLIQDLLQMESNLIVSCHFYEPSLLTNRKRNKGRFKFPGEVRVFDKIANHTVYWNHERILEKLKSFKQWGIENNVTVFVGEFGISRETPGAEEYLKAVIEACYHYDMTALIYSFGEESWEAMNYEFGPEKVITNFDLEWNKNPLMITILDGMQKVNNIKNSPF
ncbi:hypothetical protein B4U79_17525 [Dinothrombium tinctorium]|uniref:Glycoside hydrolase family 5 domain-containing protein n=1 Tax=Dinothrombium tinctorium TaxID=1965070 RepID=A0A443R864_9ACAR|nr:hypothetical protein B4U79_17525 [Dinothrombium tinctorium]